MYVLLNTLSSTDTKSGHTEKCFCKICSQEGSLKFFICNSNFITNYKTKNRNNTKSSCACRCFMQTKMRSRIFLRTHIRRLLNPTRKIQYTFSFEQTHLTATTSSPFIIKLPVFHKMYERISLFSGLCKTKNYQAQWLLMRTFEMNELICIFIWNKQSEICLSKKVPFVLKHPILFIWPTMWTQRFSWKTKTIWLKRFWTIVTSSSDFIKLWLIDTQNDCLPFKNIYHQTAESNTIKSVRNTSLVVRGSNLMKSPLRFWTSISVVYMRHVRTICCWDTSCIIFTRSQQIPTFSLCVCVSIFVEFLNECFIARHRFFQFRKFHVYEWLWSYTSYNKYI